MTHPASTVQKPRQEQQKQQLTALQEILIVDPHGAAIINDTTLHPVSLYEIYSVGRSISTSLQEFTQVFHLLLDYHVHQPAVNDNDISKRIVSSPQLACMVSRFLQTLDVAIPVLVNALERELSTMLDTGRMPTGDLRVLDTELCAYSIASGSAMNATMDLAGGARTGIWTGFITWLSVEVMALMRDSFVVDDGVVFKTTVVSCSPLVEEIVLAGNRVFAALEMREDDEAVNCGLGLLSVSLSVCECGWTWFAGVGCVLLNRGHEI